MKHSLHMAFAVVVTTLLVGCGAPVPEDVTGCSTDADCSGELVCQESLCAVVETTPRELGFQLIPTGGSTYPPQVVPVAPVRLADALTIGIDPGVRVAGTIELTGHQGQASGQLKFKQQASVSPFVGQARVEQSEYEIFVPAGTFDVTFFPDDPQLPTRVWREVVVELDADPKFRVNAQTVPVVGTLSRTDVPTRESNRVDGARVFAVSRETGSVSSMSVTNELGEFTLNVLQDSGTYDLHVAPAEPNRAMADSTTQYVPEVSYQPAFRVEGSRWSNMLDANPDARPLSLSLGEYGYAPLPSQFQLNAEAGMAIDWTGTSVTLATDAGRGRLTVRQRLDADGAFQLPLVFGTYDVEIRTPPNLPIASARFEGLELTGESDGDIKAIALERRLEARGTVVGPAGDPLANAQLSFTPREADALAEPLNVVTETDGTFHAWLDRTRYRVTVVPADPSIPRRVLEWSPDSADLGEVRLAEPALARGKVLGTPSANDEGQSWRELADVVVRAFELSADGEVVILGEAKTDSDGTFRVVLPARN